MITMNPTAAPREATAPDPVADVAVPVSNEEPTSSAACAACGPWSLVRGGAADPAWARPAILALLPGTAVLYIWGLDRDGWADGYYSVAVLAGTQSWKAFFFGAFAAGSFITESVMAWVGEPAGIPWGAS